MISVIIQARTSSSRLPNKVLLDLQGKSILEQIIRRVKNIKNTDRVIVATTIQDNDDKIVNICKKIDTDCFRGSLNDVLDRYYQVAKKFNVEHICRITSDCPLIDPRIVDLVVAKYLEGEFDYVSVSHPPTYPDGLDVEIFSFVAIERAWKEAVLPSEREHVTPYIWKNPEKFKLYNMENDKDLSHLRWTVDEEKDLKFVREVYKRLYKENKVFYMQDVLTLLEEHPELMEINKGIVRDEGYLKSVVSDKNKDKE